MTTEELKAYITSQSQNNPMLQNLGTTMDDAQIIATQLSIGRTKLVEWVITELGVIAALGPKDGETFIQGLESFCNTTLTDGHPLKEEHAGIKRALSWIKPPSKGLDIGTETAQTMLDALCATGFISSSSTEIIKNLAKIPDPFNVYEIYQAIQN